MYSLHCSFSFATFLGNFFLSSDEGSHKMVNENKISYFVKWCNMELKLFKIITWMITLCAANLTMKYSHCQRIFVGV